MKLLIAMFIFLGSTIAFADQRQAPVTDSQQATRERPQASPGNAEQKQGEARYQLSPERYAKAVAYARARFHLYIIDSIYGLLILLLILRRNWAPRIRDFAEQRSSRRWVQAMIFVPLLFLAIAVLGLPTEMHGHVLELKYNQSVQSWSSWSWDWMKGQFLSLALAVPVLWIFYEVVRRSPKRWWFYFWLVSIPIIIFVLFIAPVVVEPMFFKFEPLQAHHPALVEQIETVVHRAGMEIPPQRMFEMKASEKLNSLNAYVTGFGPSKRVVVWDTTMDRMTAPETLFVFGHEMGHYVLLHIQKSIGFTIVITFFAMFAGCRVMYWTLARSGQRLGIRGVDDWASLPLMLLILYVFGFFLSPVINGFSRQVEHQADVYGLEVTHGLSPDWRQDAVHAFQVLGEVDLADPSPTRFEEIWLYSHPSEDARIRFASTYDPWGKGETPRYVK